MVAKYKLLKTLSALEGEENMEMRLCFLCDEPITLDHYYQLKHKNIQIVLRDIDEAEVELEGEKATISDYIEVAFHQATLKNHKRKNTRKFDGFLKIHVNLPFVYCKPQLQHT
jgi:thioester reductase-like protein